MNSPAPRCSIFCLKNYFLSHMIPPTLFHLNLCSERLALTTLSHRIAFVTHFILPYFTHLYSNHFWLTLQTASDKTSIHPSINIYCLFSTLWCKIQEAGNFALLFGVFPVCLAHSNYLIIIYQVNKWIKQSLYTLRSPKKESKKS